jgi:acyl-coenzyme A synthetase/AMP-(fatty) acid ligase
MALTPDEPRRVAERFPDRLALVVDNGGSMTFAEWEGRSNAAARSLAELGVVRGDQVALLPPGEVLHRPGSVGKPIEPAAVRMVDNQRNGLPAIQVGELLTRIAGGRRHCFGEPDGTPRHGWRAGCTPGTWATWTPTDSATSWTARRV